MDQYQLYLHAGINLAIVPHQGKIAALEQECEAHRAAREDMARLVTEARLETAAQVC